MYDQLVRLNDKQLSDQLLQTYANTRVMYPENETIKALKHELYRRGHNRAEIVTIALAALIRRSMN